MPQKQLLKYFIIARWRVNYIIVVIVTEGLSQVTLKLPQTF